MQNASELVTFISPSIRLPGRSKLTRAIEIISELLRQGTASEAIVVTKSIYQPIAEEFGCRLEATERAIYRAVETCWNNGENENVHKIIGMKLPQKPAPKDFILYCAYYLLYDGPNRNPDGTARLPVLF